MERTLITTPPRIVLAGTYPLRAGETLGTWWSASQHVIAGLDGAGTITVGRRRIALAPGDVVAVPWGETLCFHANSRRGFTIASVHIVRLPWAAPDSGFPLHGSPGHAPPAAPHGLCRLPLHTPAAHDSRALAERALGLATRWDDPPSTERELSLRAGAIELVLALNGEADSVTAHHPQAGRIRDLLTWLRFNYRRPVNRRMLAERSGLGQTALGEAFKAVTGRSPTDYVIRLRLDEGRRRLRTSRDSVAMIAAQVGLADPAYFSRLFRRHFGITPRQARQT
jgi:AraC-like DNA-binding protein